MRRLSDLLGPSPFPGEDPQTQDNNDLEDKSMRMPGPDGVRPDYTVAPERPAEEFNWSMSGTHVMVSEDQHGEQFMALQWSDFDRPHAYGKLELFYNWTANWHVIYGNLSPHIIEKRLKKYTRDQGWEWGGLLDEEGMPNNSRALKQASVPGIGDINPGLKDWKNNEWAGTEMFDNPGDGMRDGFYGEQDPENDESLNGLYNCSECGAPCMGHDDLRKHIMREHVNPGRKPPLDPQPVTDLDDVLPANFNEVVMDQTRNRMAHLLFRLSHQHEAMGLAGDLPEGIRFEISRVTEDDAEWMPADDYTDPTKNIGGYIVSAMIGPSDIGQLIVDADGVISDVDVNESYRRRGVASAMLNALRDQGIDVQHSLDKTPDGRAWAEHMGASTVMPSIQGPIPFVYDIETDRIFVGHPGERHSDIQGRFTPGGIVEGLYDPKGNVQIRTDTDMPYTIRHMAELWYALHPELAIKGIYLLQGERKYRLAKEDILYKLPTRGINGQREMIGGRQFVWLD